MATQKKHRARCFASLFCTLALAAPHSSAHESEPPLLKFDRTSDGWPVPEFSLIDQNGDPLTRPRLLGQWSFVLFGDTSCASACTTGLRTLTALRSRIAGTKVLHSTQIVFVSLDPARDNAARLKDYVAPYDKELVVATGPPELLHAFADELGATQRIANASGYDGSLLLVGPEGNVWTVYLQPYDVRRLTADYLLKRVRRK